MLTYDHILTHVPLFIAVIARVGGLVVFAPVLSSDSMPRRFKVLLIVMLAAVIYPTIDHPTYAPAYGLELHTLVPLIAAEIGIGMLIGLFALIPIVSIQLAGLLMGQQLGLALAEQFNPTLNISSDNFGQLLFFTTLASFLYIGGLEFLYATLVHTFAVVPLGGLSPTEAPVELITGLLSAGFVLAARIAMPVLAIIMMETIAVGFIMKTVPALNILSFGFPIRILLGLGTFVLALESIKHTIMIDLHNTIDVIEQWAIAFGDRHG